MEKVGTVVKTFQDRAVVQCSYRCDATCTFCPVAGIFMSKDEPLELEALNPAGARVGEVVRIELDSASSLAAYGLAYGIPLVGLITGAVIGALLSRRMPRLSPTLHSSGDVAETLFVAGMGILGAAAGLFFAVRKGRNFKATSVITKIYLAGGGGAVQKGRCDKI
jgi:positive regulator of sigma E activity